MDAVDDASDIDGDGDGDGVHRHAATSERATVPAMSPLSKSCPLRIQTDSVHHLEDNDINPPNHHLLDSRVLDILGVTTPITPILLEMDGFPDITAHRKAAPTLNAHALLSRSELLDGGQLPIPSPFHHSPSADCGLNDQQKKPPMLSMDSMHNDRAISI